MSGVKVNVDISQLKGFSRAMQAAGDDVDTLMLECANALVAEIDKEVKQNTPRSKNEKRTYRTKNKETGEVITKDDDHRGGSLLNGWQTDNAKKIGNVYRARVFNTVKYAPYVEYGHRQTPGRYVPILGKRLKRAWVPGKHMLKNASTAVQKRAAKICNNRLCDFIKRIMKEGK